MLPTPGDDDCLFASLSYWVTWNMDHVNILRTIVVDHIVGNLKVACSKFIVKKIPMSAPLIMEMYDI